MSIKRTVPIVTVLLAILASTAFAAPPKSGSLLIRHQVRGCHSWSVNGGAFKATQALTLGVRGTLTVTNDDVMPHTLVQISGPTLKLKSPLMGHMSAISRVTFPTAGVYVFKTKAGEDYPMMKGMKTIGEDNVLRLVVHVS